MRNIRRKSSPKISTNAPRPEPSNPFALDFSLNCRNPFLKILAKIVESPLEKVSGLKCLQQWYTDSANGPKDFCSNLLQRMRASYTYYDEMLDKLPQTGPVVVVANHPFGGAEGVILLHLLLRKRPDVKMFANFLLGRIPELRPYFIFVDPFGSADASKKNMRPMREAISCLRSGGCLAVFPSGTVSHYQISRREVSDPEWSPTIARLIKSSGASVFPVHFHGSNGLFFQVTGLLHPILRTLQLPKQLSNKHDKFFPISVGSLIQPTKIAEFSSDEELMTYLRLRTYILGNRNKDEQERNLVPAPERELLAIAPSIAPELLAEEIASLPPSQKLIETNEQDVYYAEALQIPHILREVGRLREVTFRKVQEGTGKSLDLDDFDSFYIQLFTWNKIKQEVVGAYRLVDAAKTFKDKGLKHLYTHTLFDYEANLLEQMGPALELGRSFIREEYQKNFNSLNMLWRGIATYVERNPRYYGLFGTVSISNEYDSVSRHLIATFLEQNNYLPELAKLIRPRNPMRGSSFRGVDRKAAQTVVRDLNDVSELLMELQSKHQSIPILLKQYLKLGGKLLGFNVDKDFGNVLDGLIYIDLRETEPRLLERYMGKDEAQRFFAYHRVDQTK